MKLAGQELCKILIAAETAGNDYRIIQLLPLHESHNLLSYRVDDTCSKIFLAFAFTHVVYYLRLRKNRTDGADGNGFPFLGFLKKLLNSKAQSVGHNLDEFSRSCGALVVHQEVYRFAVLHVDELGVLASNIYNGAVPADKAVASPSVAGNFRYDFVGVIHRNPAVACGNNTGV